MRSRRLSQAVVMACVVAGTADLRAQTVLVTLRLVREASTEEQLLDPPESDTETCEGAVFFAEVWVTELDDSASGIAGGTIDIHFDSAVLMPDSVVHSNVLGTFTSGNLNVAAGRIENFGGATVNSGVGEAPMWALLGRVGFAVIEPGVRTLGMAPGSFLFALAGGDPPLDFGVDVQLDTLQAVGLCDDVNACTTDACHAGVCTHSAIPDCTPGGCGACELQGDIFPFDPDDPNGNPIGNCVVELDDILTILRAFSAGNQCGPDFPDTVNLAPCGQPCSEGIVGLDDILFILAAFSANYQCSHPCVGGACCFPSANHGDPCPHGDSVCGGAICTQPNGRLCPTGTEGGGGCTCAACLDWDQVPFGKTPDGGTSETTCFHLGGTYLGDDSVCPGGTCP